MEKQTVAFTAQNGLCCSCGICKGICPTGCISWERQEGMYLPKIDVRKCVHCGLCARLCPGLGMAYESAPTPEESMTGTVLECCNAWSRDAEKRHRGASGGVLSTMIPILLEKGLYDGVFCLDSYDYRELLRTHLKTMEDFGKDGKTPKSRYLPVSQEEAVAYIRSHPGKRLILVGTSCALRGLSGVIAYLKRERENYLLIGLFCDQVFSYNILDYYRSEQFSGGKTLTELHFKNKESGGWPGNLKFHFSDGSTCYHDQNHRAGMKAYFMPERCLYCVDKLNVTADISLGDNYTGLDESPLGSNSVILRTQRGREAWKQAADALEIRPLDVGEIVRAQALSWRANNAQYALAKERRMQKSTGQCLCLNPGLSVVENTHVTNGYAEKMARRNAGAVYPENPTELEEQIRLTKKVPLKQKIRRLLSRCYHKLFG